MKKNLILLLLLLIVPLKANADNIITLPTELLNELSKKAEFKADTNLIQSLLMTQILKNSSIDGVKLKDFKTENLMQYFSEDNVFEKFGSNKLVEPRTGATLEFNSDGNCKNDTSCTITVDLNGEKGPNEIWQNLEMPKDKIIFTIKRNSEDNIDIVLPNFAN